MVGAPQLANICFGQAYSVGPPTANSSVWLEALPGPPIFLREKFCLKWNDFQKNICSLFQEIREEFCDVILAAEGNQQITAHKVILAASVNFFKE